MMTPSQRTYSGCWLWYRNKFLVTKKIIQIWNRNLRLVFHTKPVRVNRERGRGAGLTCPAGLLLGIQHFFSVRPSAIYKNCLQLS